MVIDYYEAQKQARARNNVQEGFELISKALEKDPRFAKGHLFKAQMEMAMSNQAASKASLKKALELSSALPERSQLQIKFNYLTQTENLQKGIALLEMWSQLYPKDFNPYVQLFSFYSQLNEINKAVSIGERAIENGHQNTMSLRLAGLYNAIGEFDKSKSTLDSYISEFPNKAKENYKIGELYIQQGEFEKAKQHFEKIELLKPTEYKPALHLGEIARKRLDFKTEQKKYKQALSNAKIAQDSIAVYNIMETSLYYQGKIDDCNTLMFNKWNLQETFTPPIYVDIQRLVYPYLRRMIEAGEPERIDEHVQSIAKKYVNGPDFFKCLVEMNYGLATEDMDKINNISEECMAMNSEAGGEATAIFMEAFIAKVKGDCKNALSLIESYTEKTGLPNTNLAELMGDCYIQVGEHQKALDLLNVQLKANPEVASAHIFKAKALKGLGKNTEAKASYDMAMKIWENSDKNFLPYQQALEFGKEL